MKILMTVIIGFIGSNLAEKLLAEGNEVFTILRPTSKIEELTENLRKNVKFLTYDNNNTILDIITDLCVENNRFEVIITWRRYNLFIINFLKYRILFRAT